MLQLAPRPRPNRELGRALITQQRFSFCGCSLRQMSLNNLAINSHLNSIVLAFALNRQIDFRVRRSPKYLAYLLRRQPTDWYTVDVGNNVICFDSDLFRW